MSWIFKQSNICATCVLPLHTPGPGH